MRLLIAGSRVRPPPGSLTHPRPLSPVATPASNAELGSDVVDDREQADRTLPLDRGPIERRRVTFEVRTTATLHVALFVDEAVDRVRLVAERLVAVVDRVAAAGAEQVRRLQE